MRISKGGLLRSAERSSGRGAAPASKEHLEPNGIPFARNAGLRRLLAAAFLTNTSASLLVLALSWASISVHHTAGTIGLTQAALLAPIPVTVILSGRAAPRHGPFRVLVAALLGAALVATIAGWTAAFNRASLPLVIALTACAGAALGAISVPTSVLLHGIVPASQLRAAVALNVMGLGGSQILTGMIGGPIVQEAGTQSAALMAGFGFVAAAVLFRRVPRAGTAPAHGRDPIVVGRLSAVTWLRTRPHRLAAFMASGALATFVVSANPVIAGFIQTDLDGTALHLGWLSTSGGIGTMLGSVTVGTLARRARPRQFILACLALGGIAVMSNAPSTEAGWSILSVGAISAVSFGLLASVSVLIMSTAPARLVPGLLGLQGSWFNALLPVGMLGGVLLTDRLGPRPAFLILGACALLSSAALAVAGRRREPPRTFREDARRLIP